MRLIFKIRWTGILLLLFAVCVLEARAAEWEEREFAEQMFLSEEAALKLAFPSCGSVGRTVHVFTRGQKQNIEARLGWAIPESSVTIYHCGTQNEDQGRAVIAEEIGKFKPITFMVKVGAAGRVERVDIMVYRESVGAEVRRERFTRQFRGKTAQDPLRLNRDILNITGATMSVQAMTAGVKKALAILDEIK